MSKEYSVYTWFKFAAPEAALAINILKQKVGGQGRKVSVFCLSVCDVGAYN